MVRQKDNEKVLAMHNLTNTEISIELAQISGFSVVDFSTGNARVSGSNLILPAYSSVVLK
jgi:hypothetical protein